MGNHRNLNSRAGGRRPKVLNLESCPHYLRDGAGSYCKLIDMKDDEDYPHSFWRVMCHGNQDHPFCEGAKRNLIKKENR